MVAADGLKAVLITSRNRQDFVTVAGCLERRKIQDKRLSRLRNGSGFRWQFWPGWPGVVIKNAGRPVVGRR